VSPDEAEIRDRAETREETEHQDNAGSRDEAERPAPLRQRVAADIDRRLLRYRDRFGDFEITPGRVANETERFDAGREMAANGWRGDAGAWVTDPDGRALFVRHAASPGVWGVPGGGHEPGESHAVTARREVREETGLSVTVTGVWRARRRTVYDATDPDRELEMLTVWFEGTASGSVFDVGDDEIEEGRWFDEPPDAVADVVAPRVAAWSSE
jgi:8-oxo-dGTP pyrophosphatase MutT (NUDIX family)